MPDGTLESEVLSYEYEFPPSRPCFRPSVPCLIMLITECSSDDSATVSVNCGIALSCVGVCFPDPGTACAPLSGSINQTTHPPHTWSFTGDLSRNDRRVGRRRVHHARHSGHARHVAHRVHHGHAIHHHGHTVHHHRLLHARHTRHTRYSRHTRHSRDARDTRHAIHHHIAVGVIHQPGLHHRLLAHHRLTHLSIRCLLLLLLHGERSHHRVDASSVRVAAGEKTLCRGSMTLATTLLLERVLDHNGTVAEVLEDDSTRKRRPDRSCSQWRSRRLRTWCSSRNRSPC